MNTAQTAIVITGAVGLGTPVLTHLFEWLREKGRLDHERDLRDRDALRTKLEAVARSIDKAQREIGDVLVLFSDERDDAIDEQDRTSKVTAARKAIDDGWLALVELALWVDRDRDPGAAAQDALAGLGTMLSWAVAPDSDEAREVDDIEEVKRKAAAASHRFLSTAREKYGARLADS